MEGIKILRFLKPLFSKVGVIYMTGYGSEQVVVDFFDAGGRRYLKKPFKIPDLLAYVREYLDLRRQSREARVPLLPGHRARPLPNGHGAPDPRIASAIA